jgi:hypothetical protein
MKSLDLTTYDKKIFKLAIATFLSFSALSNAQQTDTLKVTSNLAEQQIKDQIWNLPVTTQVLPIKDYTHTGIYFNYKNNQFARKQTAEETSRYGFTSEGLFTTENGFKIFGLINLEKFTEKNMGWNLSDERTEDQQVLAPQYFYSPRSADWDNQQYLIRGGVSKNFGNLTLAAKAELNANKMARKLDPRPEIKNNQLVGELQVGYTFFTNHQLFVVGAYGRKDKDYSLVYKNTTIDFEGYPDTFLRFMAGYGRTINNPLFNSIPNEKSRYQYFSRNIISKIGGGYQFNTEHSQLIVGYNYEENQQRMYDSKTKQNEYFKYVWDINKHNAFASFRTILDNKTLNTSLNFSRQDGENFDVDLGGMNYQNRLQNLNFDINLADRKQSVMNYFLGLNAQYNQNKYYDALGGYTTRIKSLDLGVYGNKDFVLNDNSKFNLGLAFNYYTKLNSYFNYTKMTGVNEDSFYNNVAAYDYAFNTTDHFDASTTIRYIIPFKTNKTIEIYTQLKGIFATKKNDFILLNTDNTYLANFGIQLNY